MWFGRVLRASTSHVKSESAGLSSTSRISGMSVTVFLVIGGNSRKRESKCGTLARRRVHPNPPAVLLHNFLADRQPHAVSGIFGARVQPLKNGEDDILVLSGNADAVVRDRELPFFVFSLCRYRNHQRLFTAELDGIANQVLEQLQELSAIGVHHRQRTLVHHRATFL